MHLHDGLVLARTQMRDFGLVQPGLVVDNPYQHWVPERLHEFHPFKLIQLPKLMQSRHISEIFL